MKDDAICDGLWGARPDPLAPAVIRLRQATRATFRSVVGEAPLILRVDSGIKVLRGPVEAVVPEGALALMPANVAIDVENRPGASGFYRATGLILPVDVPGPRGVSRAEFCADPRALAAFDRALGMARHMATPPALREHSVLEVLLWLAEAGVCLPHAGPPSLVERLRRITGTDVGRDWRAGEVAVAMAMSEATLRRRLAEAGTTLTAVMAEQRMSRALGLLQTTTMPVSMIAAEVGYASASRFAARFRARFGLRPRAIRGKDDRLGREVDRVGSTGRVAAG